MNWEQEKDILKQAGNAMQRSIFSFHGDTARKSHDSESNREQFVGIEMHSLGFLVPLTYVLEIIDVASVTEVPRASSFIEGIICHKDKILPLLSGSRVIGVEPARFLPAKSQHLRALLLQYEDTAFAMSISRAAHFIFLDSASIERDAVAERASPNTFFEGVGKDGDRYMNILAIPKLFDYLTQLDESKVA